MAFDNEKKKENQKESAMAQEKNKQIFFESRRLGCNLKQS